MGHFALGTFAVCQYFWHIDLCLVFGSTEFLGAIGAFYSLGVMSGTIGINYSHEMMHQKTAVERWMADVLLAMVLYSHFRSEHLLVHHRYVGTPRDPVTARYNESFYRFFPRVLKQCFFSAISAERAMLRRAGRGFFHSKIPCCDMLCCRLALRFWPLVSTVLPGRSSLPFRLLLLFGSWNWSTMLSITG